jgi:YgiT-type zinc finger domain-containing protein
LGCVIKEKENMMKCTICKTGQTHPGTTTVTLQRDNSVVIIRDVPAEICENCGEYYLSAPIASRVFADADDTARRHVKVEIQRYAA